MAQNEQQKIAAHLDLPFNFFDFEFLVHWRDSEVFLLAQGRASNNQEDPRLLFLLRETALRELLGQQILTPAYSDSNSDVL